MTEVFQRDNITQPLNEPQENEIDNQEPHTALVRTPSITITPPESSPVQPSRQPDQYVRIDSPHQQIMIAPDSMESAPTHPDLIAEIVRKIRNIQVPTGHPSWRWRLALGLTNCLVFGTGMIILGAINYDLPDVIIGVIQLCLPGIGGIWAIVWGVLIVVAAWKDRRGAREQLP